MKIEVNRLAALQGVIRVPSDKSLTHRSYMFGAIADGPSVVRMPLRGEDCESTLHCLAQLGLRFEWASPTEIHLHPPAEWDQPTEPLNCGNSGTTMRLLSGLLASRPISATLVGDASLSRRPMKRIAVPLRLMGATVEGDTPPLSVVGGLLRGIDYESPVASAQVKSAALLAGLRAEGATSVTEPSLSRDHTERMLRALGVPIQSGTLVDGRSQATLPGPARPRAFEMTIPGDISSAAFFMVATALLEGSAVEFRDLSVNPTRTGILDVFSQAGVPVENLAERHELGEPVADVRVSTSPSLRPFEIAGDLVPRLIDEIPVLAVLATQIPGRSLIRDARELRVKESDRIESVADGLRRMGASVETFDDGMAITGPTPLHGTQIAAHGDHRIAMAFAVAGLIAEGTTEIEGAESIETSFPGFFDELYRLAVV